MREAPLLLDARVPLDAVLARPRSLAARSLDPLPEPLNALEPPPPELDGAGLDVSGRAVGVDACGRLADAVGWLADGVGRAAAVDGAFAAAPVLLPAYPRSTGAFAVDGVGRAAAVLFAPVAGVAPDVAARSTVVAFALATFCERAFSVPA